jgi:hypothetical protein
MRSGWCVRSPALPGQHPLGLSRGPLTAIGLAHNAAIGDRSIKSATFLNTHTDFTVPRVLGVFTDEATIAGLEKQMAEQGFLDSDKMAHTFDVLRANDLVFNYVANNWLLGKKPPAFDLLVWNKDSTRMPARLHSRYLRSCYLNNEVARGELRSTVRCWNRERSRLTPTCCPRSTTTSSRGSRLQAHPSVRRSEPVRAEHVGAHRRNRQPTRPKSKAGPTTPFRPIRRGGRTTQYSGTAPGGRTGPSGSPSRAAPRSPRPASSGARITRRSGRPRELRARSRLRPPGLGGGSRGWGHVMSQQSGRRSASPPDFVIA